MTKLSWQSVYRYVARHRWARSMLLANVIYLALVLVYHLVRRLFHAYPIHAGLFWLGWLVLNIAVFAVNYWDVRQKIKKNWEN